VIHHSHLIGLSVPDAHFEFMRGGHETNVVGFVKHAPRG
jgi:hypothetical protein